MQGKTTTGEIELSNHFSELYNLPEEETDEYYQVVNSAWQELLELSDEQVKQIIEFYGAENLWHEALLQSFTNDSNDFEPKEVIQIAKHLNLRNSIPGQDVTVTIGL